MNVDLPISHHAFGIIENDMEWPADAPMGSNSLIHPFPGGAFLYTGIHTGTVSVQTATYSRPPVDLDRSTAWETIAEVSITAQRGKLRLRSYDTDPEGPILSPSGRGTYRVRAYAQGRDTDIDGTSSLVETYRLEIWPAADTDPITYRSDDQYGAQLLLSLKEQEDIAPVKTDGRFVDGGAVDEWV